MQLLHVAAFWFRLTGNILFDLSLYVHMKYKIVGCFVSDVNLRLTSGLGDVATPIAIGAVIRKPVPNLRDVAE